MFEFEFNTYFQVKYYSFYDVIQKLAKHLFINQKIQGLEKRIKAVKITAEEAEDKLNQELSFEKEQN
jgi:hypothetical protein